MRFDNVVFRYGVASCLRMVIGNKCDLVDQRTVQKNVAQDYCNSLGLTFAETSAKNGIDVEKTFFDFARGVMYCYGFRNMRALGQAEALLKLQMMNDTVKQYLAKVYFVCSLQQS